MEIQPSASASILLQAGRLDDVREVAARVAENPSPRPIEDVVELSVAAQQLSAGAGA